MALLCPAVHVNNPIIIVLPARMPYPFKDPSYQWMASMVVINSQYLVNMRWKKACIIVDLLSLCSRVGVNGLILLMRLPCFSIYLKCTVFAQIWSFVSSACASNHVSVIKNDFDSLLLNPPPTSWWGCPSPLLIIKGDTLYVRILLRVSEMTRGRSFLVKCYQPIKQDEKGDMVM